jgi:hypothetical protein
MFTSLSTSCIPTKLPEQRVGIDEERQNEEEIMTSLMSLNEIRSVCLRVASFRDQLDGVMDSRVAVEGLLSRAVGGYSYLELLYIVRRYGNDIGQDLTYDKCVKYLYFFNDGEYFGWIHSVIPDSKQKCEGRSQEWLLSS